MKVIFDINASWIGRRLFFFLNGPETENDYIFYIEREKKKFGNVSISRSIDVNERK